MQSGFNIGFEGVRRSLCARNLKSAKANSQFISAQLKKSIDAGHTAGPFPSPPFSPFICSGVGAVPKKSGKLRLIHHLSAPTGSSVNDGIPKDLFSLQYVTIDDAISMIMRVGKGALLAKLDLRNAFRLCPVRVEDRPLLGIYWDQQYYYDLVLPFGLRSSPFIFNQMAEALQWICCNVFQVKDLIHLLDDYLTVGPAGSSLCGRQLEVILSACGYLGIPIAEEKTETPTPVLTFLGIELDTINLEARLPKDKLDDIGSLLRSFLGLHTCTKRELLSLLGKLNFAASVVHAGRPFMRRLWDAALTVPELHHHLCLNSTCRADLTWWRYLLDRWNGRSFFLHQEWIPAPHMQLYTDAAGSAGYGAFYDGRWFTGRWTAEQRDCCITYKELFPIALACSSWGFEWSSRRVEFFSDNQAVVASLRKGSCRCPNTAKLLRALFIVCGLNNFNITSSYVPGVANTVADSLSRQEIARFRRLAPGAARYPDQVLPLPVLPGETALVPCSTTHSKL